MLQPDIIKVIPLDNYKVQLTYETGEVLLFDVLPYISGDWYGRLKDLKEFNTVRVAGRTVQWSGGQDIAPHELYELSVPVSNPLESDMKVAEPNVPYGEQ